VQENVANFHRLYAKNASQIKLVQDQPFPHTLPTNSTPYYNDDGNHTGAGYHLCHMSIMIASLN
jgi:hypothetical protein